jgi:iron complex outermembrane receptor protein
MVNIPANRFEYLIRHQFPKNKHYVSVGLTQVARQTRVEKNSDYSPPPAGYFLLEANWGMSVKAFDIGISVNNALNQAYRDYLNRFRYYADDQGINVSLRLSYRFS